jgi:hypothetical protein
MAQDETQLKVNLQIFLENFAFFSSTELKKLCGLRFLFFRNTKKLIHIMHFSSLQCTFVQFFTRMK